MDQLLCLRRGHVHCQQHDLQDGLALRCSVAVAAVAAAAAGVAGAVAAVAAVAAAAATAVAAVAPCRVSRGLCVPH